MKEEISKEVKSTAKALSKEITPGTSKESTPGNSSPNTIDRRKNIICFKVKEQSDTDSAKRQQNDLKDMNAILKDKMSMDPPKITRVLRLGRYEQGKDRAIKVIFDTEEGRGKVFTRLNEMRRNKDQKIESIFMAPDLSESERSKRKGLRDELRRRKSEGEENLTIRRGRIVEKPFPGQREQEPSHS